MSRESSIVESVVRACLLWQTFYHPEEELTLGNWSSEAVLLQIRSRSTMRNER